MPSEVVDLFTELAAIASPPGEERPVRMQFLAAQSGPHEFVAGSHLTSGRILSRPYGDEQLRRRYGDQRMLKIIGPKGTTFIADTWGVHKGHMPISRPRLLLQIQYSILPVMKFEYEPVRAPNAEQFNRYTNRLVLA